MTTHPERTTAVATRMAGPLVVGCAGLTGLVALAVSDRDARGVPCPVHAATGLWCPGCGLTRAVRALVDGDVGAALGHNLLLPLALPAMVVAWWAWFRHTLGRPPSPRLHRLTTLRPLVWTAVGLTVVAFTVLRNLPVGAALAP